MDGMGLWDEIKALLSNKVIIAGTQFLKLTLFISLRVHIHTTYLYKLLYNMSNIRFVHIDN